MEMFKTQRVAPCEDNPNDLSVTDFSVMNMKGYFPVRLFNLMMGTMLAKGVPKLYATAREI